MPKLTREELFSNAFKDFLNDFTTINETTNTEINYNILTYELTCLTKNKSKCVHDYVLKIPSSRICAYWDKTTSKDGAEIWLDSEPIYCPQETPQLCDFIESFQRYFESYRLLICTTYVSYVKIVDLPNIKSIPMCNKNINLRVVYHKSHTPFPRPLTLIEEKDREIQFLQKKTKQKK